MNESKEWILGPGHVFISGQTQAGKTVLANQIHATYPDTSIFVNTQEEPCVRGQKATSVGELLELLGDGVGKINFVPPDHDAVGDLTDLLMELCTPNNDNSCLLIVDECQEYYPLGSQNHRIVLRGQGRDIKGIFLSQRPAQVSNGILTQCLFHVWVGTPAPYERDYLESKGFDWEHLKGVSTHEATVMSGGRMIDGNFTADPQYAD